MYHRSDNQTTPIPLFDFPASIGKPQDLGDVATRGCIGFVASVVDRTIPLASRQDLLARWKQDQPVKNIEIERSLSIVTPEKSPSSDKSVLSTPDDSQLMPQLMHEKTRVRWLGETLLNQALVEYETSLHRLEQHWKFVLNYHGVKIYKAKSKHEPSEIMATGVFPASVAYIMQCLG
ncbi:unnamed protein product [Aphanomyces euteiches]